MSSGPPLVGLVAPPTRTGVHEAEESGIDSLWVGGHLASPNPSPEPMAWLARLAEQSERALVGTATLVLPWYPPAVAAKQLADIDRSCAGRLIVGVGTGGEYRDDFVAAGVPFEERGSRLDESIPLLRRLWTAEPVEHRGPHFCYEGLRIHPAPARPGGPPIVVTGRKLAAMRRAVAFGDGWMPYLYSPERYARSVVTIRELADAAGRSLDSFQWMAYVMVAVDENAQTAKERAATFLGKTYSQDFNEFLDRVAVTGTLDRVAERLATFVRAGARHLVLLPCRDSERDAAERVPPWLPELREADQGFCDARLRHEEVDASDEGGVPHLTKDVGVGQGVLSESVALRRAREGRSRVPAACSSRPCPASPVGNPPRSTRHEAP